MDFFEKLNNSKYIQDMPCNYEDFLCSFTGCSKCKLSKTRKNQVPGNGPVPCDIMLIGEGPGEQEDIKGLPFVGRAGQLLTKILESGNIYRNKDIFITNIVKCRPPGNRNPENDETISCMDYLINQMLLVKPKILLLVGSPSMKTVLDKSLSITKSRGKWFLKEVPYMDDKLKIMPVFHPSYLLRNASKEKGKPKWLTWQDMLEVKRVVNEEL